MQRREKLLLFGFLAVAVAWQGWPVVKDTVFGPIEELRAQTQSLKLKVGTKEDQELAGIRAAARLKKWTDLSLPPNELDAQRLYQAWLNDLAVGAGFQDLRIAAGRRITGGANVGSAVQVNLDATATVLELSRFLDRFRKTALMHRVVQIATESPSSQGDPRLKVSLVAEGLCLSGAADRARLFPEATLAKPTSKSATRIDVADFDSFPKDLGPKDAGLRVRIGSEYLRVTRRDGAAWTVTRAVDGSMSEAHKAGKAVELAPTLPPGQGLEQAAIDRFIAGNPFAKKAPTRAYEPKLATLSPPAAVRGVKWIYTVPLSGVDLSRGKPAFVLEQGAPAGMRIEAGTGELSWTPDAKAAVGAHRATVSVTLPHLDEPLSQKFEVTLREPNQAPKIESIAPRTVYLGTLLTMPVTATDDGPTSRLSFKLGDGAPAGATIDARTGEIRYAPPVTTEPGDVKLTVVATDGGTPPLSASQTVAVRVEEDIAADTFLVARVSKDGEPEAWLYDRGNNRRMSLTRGAIFRVSEIAGRVREIGRDFVLIETSPDESLRLNLGDSVRSLKPLVLAPSPMATSATAGVVADEPAEAEIPAAAEIPAEAEVPSR